MKSAHALRTVARLGKNAVRTIRRFAAQSHVTEIPTISVEGFRNTWVGYYDRSPFRPGDDDMILAHATNYPAWRKPSPNAPASILLINWRTRQIVRHLGTTKAWNWQQGARALWLDSSRVIYNIFDENTRRYRARIVDVENGKVELASIPVQDIGPDQRIYSISYEALSLIRPDYGYRNIPVSLEELLTFGIDEYNLKSGSVRRLVNVDELTRTKRDAEAPERPKLNHLAISPDGKSGCFLYRYFSGGRRISDLLFLDIASGALRELAINNGVSHYSWLNNHQLIVTMNGCFGFGYYIIDSYSGKKELIMKFPDGHPSRVRESMIVSDAYPDTFGIRKLFIINLDEGVVREIGRFIEPMLFQGETRCDLHPSSNSSGTLLQIDVAEHFQRRIVILELDAQ